MPAPARWPVWVAVSPEGNPQPRTTAAESEAACWRRLLDTNGTSDRDGLTRAGYTVVPFTPPKR